MCVRDAHRVVEPLATGCGRRCSSPRPPSHGARVAAAHDGQPAGTAAGTPSGLPARSGGIESIAKPMKLLSEFFARRGRVERERGLAARPRIVVPRVAAVAAVRLTPQLPQPVRFLERQPVRRAHIDRIAEMEPAGSSPWSSRRARSKDRRDNWPAGPDAGSAAGSGPCPPGLLGGSRPGSTRRGVRALHAHVERRVRHGFRPDAVRAIGGEHAPGQSSPSHSATTLPSATGCGGSRSCPSPSGPTHRCPRWNPPWRRDPGAEGMAELVRRGADRHDLRAVARRSATQGGGRKVVADPDVAEPGLWRTHRS